MLRKLDRMGIDVIRREVKKIMDTKQMVRIRDVQNFVREGLDKRVCWSTARLTVHKAGFT